MAYIKVVCGKTKTRISAEIPWQSSKKCMSHKVTLALDCKEKQMKRRNPLPKPLPSPRKEANQANLGRVDFPLYPPSRLLFSTPPFKKRKKDLLCFRADVRFGFSSSARERKKKGLENEIWKSKSIKEFGHWKTTVSQWDMSCLMERGIMKKKIDNKIKK